MAAGSSHPLATNEPAMHLETLFGLLLLIGLYVLVYFRLMVRFFQSRASEHPQKTFAALLSVPPYRGLDEKGKRYARRWWYTLLLMTAIIVLLAFRLDFGTRSAATQASHPPARALPVALDTGSNHMAADLHARNTRLRLHIPGVSAT